MDRAENVGMTHGGDENPAHREKTKIMNDKLERFNELVNSDDGFTYHSKELIAYRVKFARTFGRMIEGSLYHPEKPYRLFIAYKVTHRVKRMAGRCFIWDETEETCNGINVDSKEQGFGEPRFDGMEAAVFVTDGCVIVFGNVRIETSYIGRGGKRVRCKVYLRGRLATHFTLKCEVFDRCFGLKENFPKQYEKVFGKTEDAKPVQEENNLIEEAKRNVEWCKNSLITNKYRLEKAVHLIQGALEDFDVKWHELDDMLYKLTQKE